MAATFQFLLAPLVLIALSFVSATPQSIYGTTFSQHIHRTNIAWSSNAGYNQVASKKFSQSPYDQIRFNNNPFSYGPLRSSRKNSISKADQDELLTLINQILGIKSSTSNAKMISFTLQPSIEIPFNRLVNFGNKNKYCQGFDCKRHPVSGKNSGYALTHKKIALSTPPLVLCPPAQVYDKQRDACIRSLSTFSKTPQPHLRQYWR